MNNEVYLNVVEQVSVGRGLHDDAATLRQVEHFKHLHNVGMIQIFPNRHFPVKES